MAALDIVVWPERVLETKSEKITEFDSGLETLINQMYETMETAKGIGLAANQVGIAKRLFIIKISWVADEGDDEDEDEDEKRWWHDQAFTFINPVITKTKGKTRYREGCLSFPGIYEQVDRFDEIWVTYQDEKGKQHEIHADGLFSICIQHELDHIDGIVFINRMSRLKASIIRKKFLRQGKLTEGGAAGAD